MPAQDSGRIRMRLKVTISSLIPAVCEVNISHGSKPVTALTFDAQGSKFATGSYSYSVQLFEFLKMDSSMKPFREVHPCERYIERPQAVSTPLAAKFLSPSAM